ncbi:hypothetical protein QCA50_021034 [Cerrena zonata]|uniref:Uncharacterized protein n=1 Tax=Cerrena zonata TaxID=2478898 RepID=A0AAW0FEU3_9APHY
MQFQSSRFGLLGFDLKLVKDRQRRWLTYSARAFSGVTNGLIRGNPAGMSLPSTSVFLVTIIVTLRCPPVPKSKRDVAKQKTCTNHIVSTIIQSDVTLITPDITHVVGQQTEPSLTKSRECGR